MQNPLNHFCNETFPTGQATTGSCGNKTWHNNSKKSQILLYQTTLSPNVSYSVYRNFLQGKLLDCTWDPTQKVVHNSYVERKTNLEKTLNNEQSTVKISESTELSFRTISTWSRLLPQPQQCWLKTIGRPGLCLRIPQRWDIRSTWHSKGQAR